MHGSPLMMHQVPITSCMKPGDSAYRGYNFDTWSQHWNLLVSSKGS